MDDSLDTLAKEIGTRHAAAAFEALVDNPAPAGVDVIDTDAWMDHLDNAMDEGATHGLRWSLILHYFRKAFDVDARKTRDT